MFLVLQQDQDLLLDRLDQELLARPAYQKNLSVLGYQDPQQIQEFHLNRVCQVFLTTLWLLSILDFQVNRLNQWIQNHRVCQGIL